MNTDLNFTVDGARKLLTDHDGARRKPRFCPACHLRHPCDVYLLAEDVVNLHDALLLARALREAERD